MSIQALATLCIALAAGPVLDDCAPMDAALSGLGLPPIARMEEILVGADTTDAGSDWIRVLVLPSFEAEWSVTVSVETGRVTYCAAERQIWGASCDAADAHTIEGRGGWPPEYVAVPVARTSGAVSVPVAKDLRSVWRLALQSLAAEQRIGNDGTMYRFSTSAGACGDAWSPLETSPAGQLVALAEGLRELAAVRGTASDADEQALALRARRLSAVLREANAP